MKKLILFDCVSTTMPHNSYIPVFKNLLNKVLFEARIYSLYRSGKYQWICARRNPTQPQPSEHIFLFIDADRSENKQTNCNDCGLCCGSRHTSYVFAATAGRIKPYDGVWEVGDAFHVSAIGKIPCNRQSSQLTVADQWSLTKKKFLKVVWKQKKTHEFENRLKGIVVKIYFRSLKSEGIGCR